MVSWSGKDGKTCVEEFSTVYSHGTDNLKYSSDKFLGHFMSATLCACHR